MQYQISGIHINIGDALQTYVKDELKNTIDKYAERPTDTQVVFSKNGHEHVCDVIIHLSSGLKAQAKLPNQKFMPRLMHVLKKWKSN